MKTIGIYPNTVNDMDFLGTAKVIDTLRGKARIMMHESLRAQLCASLGDGVCNVVDFAADRELYTAPDAMVVLGGDGTIIKAARQCMAGKIPLVGVNLGRIGYMAELEPHELHLLERLCGGDYTVESRMMIEAMLGGKRLFALNEVVLGGESVFRIVEIELYCDGNLVNCYRADGLIASTPTGSTAYSMSAGGAVVDPRMEALLITPICSHSLSATPLVFSAESELKIKNVTLREEKLYLNADGCETYPLMYGETVTVRRCKESVGFIRLKEGGFYEALRHKMADRY